jgi:hypothetical protein
VGPVTHRFPGCCHVGEKRRERVPGGRMHAGRERLDAQRGVVGQQNGICLPRPGAADGSTRHNLVGVLKSARGESISVPISPLWPCIHGLTWSSFWLARGGSCGHSATGWTWTDWGGGLLSDAWRKRTAARAAAPTSKLPSFFLEIWTRHAVRKWEPRWTQMTGGAWQGRAHVHTHIRGNQNTV